MDGFFGGKILRVESTPIKMGDDYNKGFHLWVEEVESFLLLYELNSRSCETYKSQ